MKLTQLTIAGLLLAEGRGRTPPPTNDKCSDATEIEIQRQGNAVSMDGTLVGATMDVDVPICTYSNWDYRGVWYKITTSEYVGDISIDLCGLNDGKGDVSVYSTTKTDDDCSSITCVAGQDVYCEPSEEEKLVVPVDGTVYNYYIRVVSKCRELNITNIRRIQDSHYLSCFVYPCLCPPHYQASPREC